MDPKALNQIYTYSYWINKLSSNHLVCILAFLFSLSPIVVLAEQEVPLEIPKMEGSKSFDFEIDQLNDKGIDLYQQRNFKQAGDQFKKALNLAEQFRDPSQGILHFNYALSLHHLGNHKEALKALYSARRFARGNPKILNSELLRMYECGLNPSVPCENKVPLEMNIEGSH
ncbi:MAG: tetratricopeptide repeat protein [Nitrospinota bacterium]|nr:tetratricopeptide repeat protein [Nitrospinota bacterium]